MKTILSAFTATILLVCCTMSFVTARAVAAPSGEGLFLVATGSAMGSQYVTLKSQGTITILNTGISAVHITSITSTDSDFVNGYITMAPQIYPINLGPGNSITINVTFAPNAPNIIAGERNYSVKFNIISDAAGVTATVTGTGVLVHGRASIARTFTGKDGDTVIVPVKIDQWTDPLGLASIRGLQVDLLHYRRTIVKVDPAYNTGGAGQVGTMTVGATVAENIASDTMSDPGHTSGTQGFYSLSITKLTTPLQAAGTLLNMRFFALNKTDTSELPTRVYDFRDFEGNPMPYVIVSTTSGAIHIDSTAKISAVHQLADNPTATTLMLQPNAPNPFSSSTDVRFTLSQSTRAKLYVCDAVGRIVTMLVDGEFSAGEHHALFTAGALPNGQYFAVLRTPSGIVKQDMALVR